MLFVLGIPAALLPALLRMGCVGAAHPEGAAELSEGARDLFQRVRPYVLLMRTAALRALVFAVFRPGASPARGASAAEPRVCRAELMTMSRRVEPPGIHEGCDRWSETCDATPNPLVALNPRKEEWVLEAGRGRGTLLAALRLARSRAIGLDFNFEREGTEHRVRAERCRIADHWSHISDVGFRKLEWRKGRGDQRLAEGAPPTSKHLERALLLLAQAERAV